MWKYDVIALLSKHILSCLPWFLYSACITNLAMCGVRLHNYVLRWPVAQSLWCANHCIKRPMYADRPGNCSSNYEPRWSPRTCVWITVTMHFDTIINNRLVKVLSGYSVPEDCQMDHSRSCLWNINHANVWTMLFYKRYINVFLYFVFQIHLKKSILQSIWNTFYNCILYFVFKYFWNVFYPALNGSHW